MKRSRRYWDGDLYLGAQFTGLRESGDADSGEAILSEQAVMIAKLSSVQETGTALVKRQESVQI